MPHTFHEVWPKSNLSDKSSGGRVGPLKERGTATGRKKKRRLVRQSDCDLSVYCRKTPRGRLTTNQSVSFESRGFFTITCPLYPCIFLLPRGRCHFGHYPHSLNII